MTKQTPGQAIAGFLLVMAIFAIVLVIIGHIMGAF